MILFCHAKSADIDVWWALQTSYDVEKIVTAQSESLESVRATHPDHEVVWFMPEPRDRDFIWLNDFEHPEKAIYVFGPETQTVLQPPDGDPIVAIEVATKNITIFSATAAAIVLYHRHLNQGTNQ